MFLNTDITSVTTAKMLLFWIFAASLSVTAGRVVDGEFTFVQGGEDELKWPEQYSVKAKKMSFTSGLIEDFTIWWTETKSRMDNEYVTTIKTVEDEAGSSSCEVHPETDQNEEVEFSCRCLMNKTLSSELDSLPDVYYNEYEATGNDSVLDREATKFEYYEDGTYYTLWAAYDYMENGNYGWIPIRYEMKEYDQDLGFVSKHTITDYYDFSLEFDDDVFDLEDHYCDERGITKISPDSDAVIKELQFIDTKKKEHVDYIFNSFKDRFNRKYAHEAEHKIRRNIFKKNMQLIASTNRQNLGFKLAVNHLSDRTPEELEKLRGLKSRPPGKVGNIPFPYTKEKLNDIVDKLPREVDLRLEGLVTPVQYQGACGACWTYGTTSAVEGALAKLNGGRLLRLSNQAVLDCAWGFGAVGCDGGSDTAAYEWMMEYGLPTVEEYGEYEEKDGLCHNQNMTTYPIRGYTDVTPLDNNALKVALFYHGPLTVSMEGTDKFSQYSSGIFYDTDCTQSKYSLNHLVSLVGYGERYGKLYWILKNSWGVNWGEDGYMLISAKDNCGITIQPTYVVL